MCLIITPSPWEEGSSAQATTDYEYTMQLQQDSLDSLDQISLVSLDHFSLVVRRWQHIPQFCWLLSCVLFFPYERSLAGAHFSKMLTLLLVFLLIKSSFFFSCAMESPSWLILSTYHWDAQRRHYRSSPPTPLQGTWYEFFFKEWGWGWICARLPSWPHLPGIHQLSFARWLAELRGATGAKTKTQQLNSGP